jgi:hypothetical protein
MIIAHYGVLLVEISTEDDWVEQLGPKERILYFRGVPYGGVPITGLVTRRAFVVCSSINILLPLTAQLRLATATIEVLSEISCHRKAYRRVVTIKEALELRKLFQWTNRGVHSRRDICCNRRCRE